MSGHPFLAVNQFDRLLAANLAAALEHNDRICKINCWGIPSPQMGEILAAMRKPFPSDRSVPWVSK